MSSAVRIQNLKPDVLMMEPAKDWYRDDAADLLGLPEIWSVFLQREMGPDLIVVRSVSLQDGAQVRFAKHDDVVERFATYRSDEPLDMAIPPRGARCSRMIADLHCTNAADVNRTEGAVAVANQMPRRFVPRKGINSRQSLWTTTLIRAFILLAGNVQIQTR